MSEETFTLELGCAPGSIRPDDLLVGVLENTGIDLSGVEATKSFGDWEWVIPEDQIEVYKSVRDLIKERIKCLYNRGAIRYGSW